MTSTPTIPSSDGPDKIAYAQWRYINTNRILGLKTFFKTIASALGIIAVLPAVGVYRLGVPLLGPEKAFAGWSQLFSLLPGLTGVYLRRAFYRLVFSRCGDGVYIGFGTLFSHPTAQLGRNVYIGVFCCLGDVTLEEDVLLGSHVSIPNGGRQHGIDRLDVPVREQPGEWPRITIGHDTWIGDRAVVMADVGRHCVIGAGAVVTEPLPDYAIAVGVPARVVGSRRDDTRDRSSTEHSRIQAETSR